MYGCMEGGDCNISIAFLKERGDTNNNHVLIVTPFYCTSIILLLVFNTKAKRDLLKNLLVTLHTLNSLHGGYEFYFLAFFFILSAKPFQTTIREPNSLNPDLARHIVGPDLGLNYLQRQSEDDKEITSR